MTDISLPLVLLEPVKSAEPPRIGWSPLIKFKIASEDFLVAWSELKFFKSNSILLNNLSISFLDKVEWNVDLDFLYNFLFLSADPLQIFKSLSGIWNGFSLQDNLLLVKLTSSEPKGEPCDEDFCLKRA